MKARTIALAALVLLSAFLTVQPLSAAQSARTAVPTLSSAAVQHGSVGAPVQVQVTITDHPAPRSPAELQRLHDALQRVNPPAPALSTDDTAVDRVDSVVDPSTASVVASPHVP